MDFRCPFLRFTCCCHLVWLALPFSHPCAASLTPPTHVCALFEPSEIICRHHAPLSIRIQCMFLRRDFLLHRQNTFIKIRSCNIDTVLLSNPWFILKFTSCPNNVLYSLSRFFVCLFVPDLRPNLSTCCNLSSRILSPLIWDSSWPFLWLSWSWHCLESPGRSL